MRDKVLQILREVRPEFDFTEDVDFIENGMLDSFDVFNLVTSLDKEFGISIDGMDVLAENFTCIEKIEKLLVKNGARL